MNAITQGPDQRQGAHGFRQPVVLAPPDLAGCSFGPAEPQVTVASASGRSYSAWIGRMCASR